MCLENSPSSEVHWTSSRRIAKGATTKETLANHARKPSMTNRDI